MKVKSLISLFMATTALLFLDSCSRESPLKENVGLQNNHSRVFASREPFKDAQAFVDSIANTPVDTNLTPDTLTVTINDSVYLIGVLPRFVEKIYLFQWNVEDGDSTVSIKGDNAEPFAWAYKKPGVYYPKFIAFDGNNATDTAGTGTKRLYINVIDTKPVLSVPKDTLWTSHDGDVKFSIFAADTFGVIKNVKIDLDASGKDSAKVWEYEQEEGEDSLFITIKNDKKYIDSLGNQTIYVIVEDDDGNEVMDSVNIHFNRLPTLKIVSPTDGSRHSIKDRFYFYYESEDKDNPQDLRYFIYAQTSKNGKPPTKAFTNEDLIAKAVTVNIFEPTTEDGRNVITLVNDPSTELTGRIYWDMYVTDGYDIVRMERVATTDSTSRPWNFYLGDLSSSQGTFFGVAKYQGRDNHAGIRVEFNNGSKVFDGFTDEKGNYTIKADVGAYEVRASSDTIHEYEYAFQYDLFIESGATIKVDDLILADTTSPTLVVKDLDTLDVRKIESLNIYAKDLASRVDTVFAKLDDKNADLTCIVSEYGVIVNCGLSLDNLLDGDHVLTITAKDKVGNTSVKKNPFYVAATKLALNVNGVQKDKIGKNSTNDLVFTAEITNAYPEADSVTWSWTIEDKSGTEKAKVTDGKATFKLSYDDIINNFTNPDDPKHAENDFTMTVSYNSNGADISSSVLFGILSGNPTVVFTEPGNDVKVTINDPIKFSIVTYPGENSSTMETTWNCGTKLSSGYTCPAKGATEGTLAFSTIGKHEITVTVKDNNNDTGTDKVTIEVVSDKPTIAASTNDKSNEYKINSKVKVNLAASDKQGTVNEIKWGCSNGDNLESVKSDNSIAVTPAASVEASAEITMPGFDTDHFRCLFRAIDDDGEEGRDTLTFVALLDPPQVHLKTKADTVKIKSEQKIVATATDKLGVITKYEIACEDKLSNITSWTTMSKSDTIVKMPDYATNYYCIVRVTDDDKNTALDTATYTVLVGRPTVTAKVNYSTVTIKDTVELNAHATDSLGSIDMYAWGCGTSSNRNIVFTDSSSKTPLLRKVMPSKEDHNYLCIIRVRDDDGNTAKDTVKIDVLQGMPTVTVKNKFAKIQEGRNIILDAEASDNNGVASDVGEIVKYEWSCAIPEKIAQTWREVDKPRYDWKAPAQNDNLICVIRVTDNDGNTAMDTMKVAYTSEYPRIWVTSENIYINQGDRFTLNATVNEDIWQGIDWFNWECFNAETKKTMESSVPNYSYKDNDKSFEIDKDSSYSIQGKDMFCVVSARETATQEVLKDTTIVHILRSFPVGVITAADTVYLWSGEEGLPDEATMFYTEEWGGKCSKRGELSDPSTKQDFRWQFSNYDESFWVGNSDGSLDMGNVVFNTAFQRPTREGSMTIQLDYRDSSITGDDNVPYGFYQRHKAETVSKTVYFSKAWKNLANDTIVASEPSGIPPAFTFVGSTPVSAYLSGKNTVKISTNKNGSWSSIGSFTTTDSVASIQLASDGKDLYIGALTTKSDFILKKSTNGTSAPADVNSTSGIKAPKLLSSTAGKIVLVHYNSSYISVKTLKDKSWTNMDLAKPKTFSGTLTEIDAVYTSKGNLLIVYVGSDFNSYALMLDANLNNKINHTSAASNMTSISIDADDDSLYIAYMDRSTNSNGAKFITASITGSSFGWGSARAIFGKAYMSYHNSIAVRNKAVYIAIDFTYSTNLNRVYQSQVNVFRYEKGQWHVHGENNLPYFTEVFAEDNGYSLSGMAPQLAFDNGGKLHVSMYAKATGTGANTKYTGPMVMKYVADNWTINSTCED